MVFSDLNGTPLATIKITANGFTDLTRRHFDPYGNTLGGVIGTWPDHNRYLNQPANVPSLVDMGARLYDPILGRFLSDDPILTPYNPEQNNGYNYAYNNPLAHPDPTGLWSDAAETWHYKDHLQTTASTALTGKGHEQDDAARIFLASLPEEGHDPIDWKGIGSAVTGFVVGAIIFTGCAAGTAFVGTVGCGVVAGAAGSATTSTLNGNDIGTVAKDAATGGLFGGLFAGLGYGASKTAQALRPATPTITTPGLPQDVAVNKMAAEAGGTVGFRSDTAHIFRNATGHLAEDTPGNRAIVRGAVRPENLRSTVTLGEGGILDKYFQDLPDGTQAWAEVREGFITNGGLNVKPR
ncbi:hypothetical protein D1871_22540 [Nakamurella silvestris]|nr:hypothetical protein D1871_22540 [Nakamurella silvestris]